MAVKTERDLGETESALWLKALAAIELRNFGYAISLLRTVLKHEPQFLTGRQLLRRAEVAKQKTVRKSFFNISTAPIAVMKAWHQIKRAPQQAIEIMENVLEEEPYHRQANLTLKDAAVAAGWPEIGVFALRTLLEENPRDVILLHQLGQLYHQAGQSEEEVNVYNRITEIDPLDPKALRLGKEASARASITSGGWTKAQSYRDLLENKEAAVSPEQKPGVAPRRHRSTEEPRPGLRWKGSRSRKGRIAGLRARPRLCQNAKPWSRVSAFKLANTYEKKPYYFTNRDHGAGSRSALPADVQYGDKSISTVEDRRQCACSDSKTCRRLY